MKHWNPWQNNGSYHRYLIQIYQGSRFYPLFFNVSNMSKDMFQRYPHMVMSLSFNGASIIYVRGGVYILSNRHQNRGPSIDSYCSTRHKPKIIGPSWTVKIMCPLKLRSPLLQDVDCGLRLKDWTLFKHWKTMDKA